MAVYEFGPYRLDPGERLLMREGQPVPLTPKAFETLVALLAADGHVVTKRRLLRRVWPDTMVSEATLTQNIFILRKALRVGTGDLDCIETIPRHGYRFTRPTKRTGARAIAVLPLQVIGGGADDRALGLGLAGALITRLSALGQFLVPALSAAMRQARLCPDPIAAGRKLHAEAVLEGTIRQGGSSVRVSMRLVNVGDGKPLWVGSFDTALTDVLAVEDVMAERIVGDLMRTILAGDEGEPRAL